MKEEQRQLQRVKIHIKNLHGKLSAANSEAEIHQLKKDKHSAMKQSIDQKKYHHLLNIIQNNKIDR
jgi:hypothetical protein